MGYFIATGLDWQSGQIVDNDTFRESPHKTFFLKDIPKYLEGNSDYLARREAEARFEKVRTDRFPEAPSRKEAIFLNATTEDALRWTTMAQRQNYRIYELSVLEAINSVETNYIWFNYCVRLIKDPSAEFRQILAVDVETEINRVAEAYWNNDPTDPHNEVSRAEILFVGVLRVLRVCSEGVGRP